MADDSAFVFNVPTNVSFTNDFDDFDENVDRYFDLGEQETKRMRRSMSVGNIIMFSEAEDRQEDNDVENIREHLDDLHMQQGRSNEQGKAPFARHGLNNSQRPAAPKRYQSAEKLAKSNPDKYVSFAEAVRQFQTRTPIRFRSKRNGSVDSDLHNMVPMQLTHPQSPCLQTKARSRPFGNVQSTKERELLEFENIRKFKIKALPVNKKMLHGPLKPPVPVEKRPLTVLQPFNITQVPAKKVVPASPKVAFHARPAPKPRTSQVAAQSPAPVAQQHEQPLEGTVLMPFSFEQRDKMVQRKKNQYIQKILDEEKRAREFSAKPLPKAIYKISVGSRRNSASSSESSKPCDPSVVPLCKEFRAKPATVLLKEPFVPIPTAKPPTEPEPFHLESEQRRQEREKYEMQKRLKNEHLAVLRQEFETNRLRLEQQEVLRLRKEAEYKAQPIKVFKPLVIKPSGKVTVPVSPKLNRK